MSARHTIIDKVVDRLELIKTANGFKTDIELVSEKLKTPEETGDKFPVCYVVDGDETKLDGSVEELNCRLEILIVMYVHDVEDPGLKLRNLIEDVERALTRDENNAVDHMLGGIARVENILPARIITDKQTLNPFGVAEASFTVIYKHDYGTP